MARLPTRPAAEERRLAIEPSRAEISARLEGRRAEIEQATLTRVYGVADPAAIDPEYMDGLREAVSAAIDFGIATVRRGEGRDPPAPPILLSQARLAACSGVSLDVVLRRYFVGFTLFGDFVLQEAERSIRSQGVSLHRLLQAQAVHFDRLVAAVCDEYTQERDNWLRSSERRQAERVEKLLVGELADTSSLAHELAYDFNAWHIGVIASGPEASEAVHDLATSLDRRLLVVRPRDGTIWAWIGSRQETDSREIGAWAAMHWPSQITAAIGEPNQGFDGWQTTHRQAKACLSVAMRGPESVVRYSAVALLASMIQDDLLVNSLRQLYLRPLFQGRDGGEVLRQTLRAYLAAERNVSSAAAALGVSRSTVSNRLRAIEKRLGRPLASCAAELDAALRLDELEAHRNVARLSVSR